MGKPNFMAFKKPGGAEPQPAPGKPAAGKPGGKQAQLAAVLKGLKK